MNQVVSTKEKNGVEPMSYRDSIEARRRLYTAEIHSRIAARWPAADQIGVRANGSYPTHVLERLPKDTAERVAELERRIEQCREELRKDQQRYTEILTNGQAAIGDYDIGIAYGENPAASAVEGALRLKSAHISYAETGLLKLRAAHQEAQEQLERERPQLALF